MTHEVMVPLNDVLHSGTPVSLLYLLLLLLNRENHRTKVGHLGTYPATPTYLIITNIRTTTTSLSDHPDY
jgi:hypothetical protein